MVIHFYIVFGDLISAILKVHPSFCHVRKMYCILHNYCLKKNTGFLAMFIAVIQIVMLISLHFVVKLYPSHHSEPYVLGTEETEIS